MKRGTSDLSTYNFYRFFWYFKLKTFYFIFWIFFFTWYDWKVALIFSGDLRKTGVFGLKRMADEFPFRFIDLLFLCNSFLYFRLQLIRTKRFLRIQSSFDWQELYLYKGSLLYWKGVSAFCYGMFYLFIRFVAGTGDFWCYCFILFLAILKAKSLGFVTVIDEISGFNC